MYVGRKEVWENLQENSNSDRPFLVVCIMGTPFVLSLIISCFFSLRKKINIYEKSLKCYIIPSCKTFKAFLLS